MQKVNLNDKLRVRDSTKECGKKNHDTMLMTNKYLRQIKLTNKTTLTQGQIYQLIYKIYLEEIVNWLIVEKQTFKFAKGMIELRVVNKDSAFKGFRYNIERSGNDPVLFIKAHKNMYKKLRKYFIGTFTGESKILFDEFRERREEYISLKETGYVKA